MLAAIEQAGVKLQIGFMRRFDAGFVAAKQRIEAGEIGRVVLVKSLTHGPTTPKPWMYDIRQSNGPLSEVNSHDIDSRCAGSAAASSRRSMRLPATTAHPRPAAIPRLLRQRRPLGGALPNGMQGSISGAQGVQYGYDAAL